MIAGTGGPDSISHESSSRPSILGMRTSRTRPSKCSFSNSALASAPSAPWRLQCPPPRHSGLWSRGCFSHHRQSALSFGLHGRKRYARFGPSPSRGIRVSVPPAAWTNLRESASRLPTLFRTTLRPSREECPGPGPAPSQPRARRRGPILPPPLPGLYRHSSHAHCARGSL